MGILDWFRNNEDSDSVEDTTDTVESEQPDETNQSPEPQSNSENTDILSDVEQMVDDVKREVDETNYSNERLQNQLDEVEEKLETLDKRTKELTGIYDMYMRDENPLIPSEDTPDTSQNDSENQLTEDTEVDEEDAIEEDTVDFESMTEELNDSDELVTESEAVSTGSTHSSVISVGTAVTEIPDSQLGLVNEWLFYLYKYGGKRKTFELLDEFNGHGYLTDEVTAELKRVVSDTENNVVSSNKEFPPEYHELSVLYMDELVR